MLFFGHVGLSVGVVQSFNEISHAKNASRRSANTYLDLRIAALMGLLPDLIDKPLGILGRDYFKNHTRLIGHSLVMTVLIYFIARQIPRLRQNPMAWSGVYLFHMFLDRVWYKNLEWFLWPFLGTPWPEPTPMVQRWLNALKQPYTLFGEVLGLTILIIIGYRHRLYRVKNLKIFLQTGQLIQN